MAYTKYLSVVRVGGFVKLKKEKIREKWVGGSSPNSDFFFFRGNVVYFLFFLCCFLLLYVLQKKLYREWVGGGWPIRVFLGFWDFLNLTRSLNRMRKGVCRYY